MHGHNAPVHGHNAPEHERSALELSPHMRKSTKIYCFNSSASVQDIPYDRDKLPPFGCQPKFLRVSSHSAQLQAIAVRVNMTNLRTQKVLGPQRIHNVHRIRSPSPSPSYVFRLSFRCLFSLVQLELIQPKVLTRQARRKWGAEYCRIL